MEPTTAAERRSFLSGTKHGFGKRLIADLEAAVRERDEAVALLREWGDALYECKAATCRQCGGMHLRNFDAARPTLAFLEPSKEYSHDTD